MVFDPKKHLITIQGGRMYLPVSARLIWFRMEHPNWGIETDVVAVDIEKKYAIFRARIYDDQGKLMATGTKMEDVKGFPDYLEKAETGAVGRALALCGYGTQFAPELDEVGHRRTSESSAMPDLPLRTPHDSSLSDGDVASRATDTLPAEIHANTNHVHDNKSETEQPKGEPPVALECSACGKKLTKSQAELSVRNFGEPLCPSCQKEKVRAK